jgi:hypothetical protein
MNQYDGELSPFFFRFALPIEPNDANVNRKYISMVLAF